MILYVLAALFVVGAVLMLWTAWMAAAAVLFGTGILGVIAYRLEVAAHDEDEG